jgi:hypothetical protein
MFIENRDDNTKFGRGGRMEIHGDDLYGWSAVVHTPRTSPDISPGHIARTMDTDAAKQYDLRMKQRRDEFNPKRRLKELASADQDHLAEIAKTVRYTGNAEHKRSPGDFGLTPPASPRRGKTLCDTIELFERSIAVNLLKMGLMRGLVDQRWAEETWPKLIWAVTENDEPVEAQHEQGGAYHGYPLPSNDPMYDKILKAWRKQ